MIPRRPSASWPVPAATKMYPGVAGGKYYLIDTLPKWNDLASRLKTKQYLACDTETSGLSYITNHIIGTSFSFGAEESYYIPFRHVKLSKDPTSTNPKKPKWLEEDSDEKQISIEQILPDLKEIYGDPNRVLIFHHAKFDLHFLMKEGIEIRGIVHDTMLMHNLLNENASAKLKELAVAHIDHQASKWEHVVEEYRTKFARSHKIPKKEVHYGMVPIDILAPYAAADTHYTWALFKLFQPQIIADPALRSLYVKVESRLLHVLLNMEHEGTVLDCDYLECTSPEMEKKLDKLREIVWASLGKKVNIESNVQVIPLLEAKGIKFYKKTKIAGKPSLDAEVLEAIASKHQVAADLQDFRKTRKLKTTYVDNLIEMAREDQKIHSNYNQNVSTGRLCIAKGSFIQAPCDRSSSTNGILIENIKAGDLVYSYNTKGKLLLRKVIWAGSTGVKPVVEIRWMGSGHKHKGSLKLTYDHKVLLTNGRWIKAKNLKKGHRIMSLSVGVRRDNGYVHLYARFNRDLRENLFIAKSLDSNCTVGHHKDFNKLNNTVDNIEALKNKAEHSSLHYSLLSREEKLTKASYLQRPETRKKQLDSILKGIDHHNWKEIERSTLLRWAAVCKGKYKLIRKMTGMDFTVLKRKYQEAGIDLKVVRKRYGSDGKYLSPKRLSEALKLVQPFNYKSVNTNFYNFKKLCQQFELASNHEVLEVVDAGTSEVFDIEVEETHSFIANELCVHNSGTKPNLMNIPRGDTTIRAAFVPPKRAICLGGDNPVAKPPCGYEEDWFNPPDKCPRCGGKLLIDDKYFLLLIDYSQIEVRLTAHYSQDQILLDVYNNTDEDVHLRTCCEMFGYNYKEAEKILGDDTHSMYKEIKKKRQIAKMMNFLIIYGGGAKNLAVKISTPTEIYTEQECKVFIYQYKKKYRGLTKWIAQAQIQVQKDLFAQNWFGRYRRLPELKNAASNKFIPSEKWKIERALRQAINYYIQGTAADLFKIAMVRISDLLQGTKSRVVMPIHDELIFYFHESDLHLLSQIVKDMEDFDFRVPITTTVSFAKTSWADKKELKL
jgi:DNA polymerase I-like protein with 3'-5' exonuclease and polymerase domains